MTHTVYRVHSFECDAPGCSEEFEELGFKSLAWKDAARHGWRENPPGTHYCPAHAYRAEVPPNNAWPAALGGPVHVDQQS